MSHTSLKFRIVVNGIAVRLNGGVIIHHLLEHVFCGIVEINKSEIGTIVGWIKEHRADLNRSRFFDRRIVLNKRK